MPDAPVTQRMEAAASAAVVLYPAGPEPDGSEGTGPGRAGQIAPSLPAGTFAKAGSPLFLDTVDVLPGDVWAVLLEADNPGICDPCGRTATWNAHRPSRELTDSGSMMGV